MLNALAPSANVPQARPAGRTPQAAAPVAAAPASRDEVILSARPAAQTCVPDRGRKMDRADSVRQLCDVTGSLGVVAALGLGLCGNPLALPVGAASLALLAIAWVAMQERNRLYNHTVSCP